MRVSKAATVCLVVNVVCLGAYLFSCSRLWVDMPGGMLYADDGPSAISWFLTAFPLMLLCALTDVVMLVVAIRQILAGKNWRLMTTCLLLIGAWVLAQLYVQDHVMSQ